MTAHILYRMWNAEGKLIYIGISRSAMVRLSGHSLKNAEKNIAKHPSEDNWNKLVALRRERKDFEMRIQEQKCPFWL